MNTIYLIVGILIVCIIVALWSILTNRKTILPVILIPFFLFSAYKMYDFLNQSMGYPVDLISDVEFSVLNMTADYENMIGYIWVLEKGKTEPRAYRFELNNENKREMQKAQEGISGGYSVENEGEDSQRDSSRLKLRIIRPIKQGKNGENNIQEHTER